MIFNHERYIDSARKKRNGSDRDRNMLKDVLKKKLQFDVKLFQDRSTKQITLAMEQVANMDHTNNDCLLINVMTHGNKETLFTHDGEITLDVITDMFSDARCPSLRGKPRILLIESCRGKSQNIEMEKNVHYECNNVGDDFLIVRSTMPGCKSYRDRKTGSWFIQQFCSTLEKDNNKTTYLLRLLDQVNDAVQNNHCNADKNQTISISSRPHRDIIFTKKPSKFERFRQKLFQMLKS